MWPGATIETSRWSVRRRMGFDAGGLYAIERRGARFDIQPEPSWRL
jgi:hypothetical protein